MPKPVLNLLLAVLAMAVSGCAMIDRMSGVEETRRIQETGTPATARILEVWDTGMTVNDDPVIGLRVEVSPVNGPAYTATIAKSLVSRIHIPQFQPGSTVPVRVDPRDSSKVALDVYRYR